MLWNPPGWSCHSSKLLLTGKPLASHSWALDGHWAPGTREQLGVVGMGSMPLKHRAGLCLGCLLPSPVTPSLSSLLLSSRKLFS